MSATAELRTERLVLRRFRDEDLGPYARLCADPVVMEHLGGPLPPDAAAAQLRSLRAHWDAHGFGRWAVEVRGASDFAGWIGLARPAWEPPFGPYVEVGWRLAAACWNQGLATEGARAALAHGFEVLGLDEIVSFTVPANRASRRVMEKLGMAEAGAFEHPALPPGHPLRPHVLYRLPRETFRAAGARTPRPT